MPASAIRRRRAPSPSRCRGAPWARCFFDTRRKAIAPGALLNSRRRRFAALGRSLGGRPPAPLAGANIAGSSDAVAAAAGTGLRLRSHRRRWQYLAAALHPGAGYYLYRDKTTLRCDAPREGRHRAGRAALAAGRRASRRAFRRCRRLLRPGRTCRCRCAQRRPSAATVADRRLPGLPDRRHLLSADDADGARWRCRRAWLRSAAEAEPIPTPARPLEGAGAKRNRRRQALPFKGRVGWGWVACCDRHHSHAQTRRRRSAEDSRLAAALARPQPLVGAGRASSASACCWRSRPACCR